MSFVNNILSNLLIAMYRAFSYNYGITTIVTILAIQSIKIIQIKNKKKVMQHAKELKPKAEEILSKYDNPDDANDELAEFYEKEGFDPFYSIIFNAVVLIISFIVFRVFAFPFNTLSEELISKESPFLGMYILSGDHYNTYIYIILAITLLIDLISDYIKNPNIGLKELFFKVVGSTFSKIVILILFIKLLSFPAVFYSTILSLMLSIKGLVESLYIYKDTNNKDDKLSENVSNNK